MTLSEFLAYAGAGLSTGLVFGFVVRCIRLTVGSVYRYGKMALRQ